MVVAPFKCICDVYQLQSMIIPTGMGRWIFTFFRSVAFGKANSYWRGVMQKQSVPERCPTSLKSIARVSVSCFWGTTIISFGIFFNTRTVAGEYPPFLPSFSWWPYMASTGHPHRCMLASHHFTRPWSRRSFACSHNSKDWRLSGWSTANNKTWCWE